MAYTKNTRTAHRIQDAGLGLLANGSSGGWAIDIDEATSGADRWYAQIEGPSVSICYEMPSLDVVGKTIQFLESRQVAPKGPSTGPMEGDGSLVIGKDSNSPVTLIKDDEFDDRFFLVVGPMDGATVRFVIAGSDVVNIAEALRQIKEDIDDND